MPRRPAAALPAVPERRSWRNGVKWSVQKTRKEEMVSKSGVSEVVNEEGLFILTRVWIRSENSQPASPHTHLEPGVGCSFSHYV